MKPILSAGDKGINFILISIIACVFHLVWKGSTELDFHRLALFGFYFVIVVIVLFLVS